MKRKTDKLLMKTAAGILAVTLAGALAGCGNKTGKEPGSSAAGPNSEKELTVWVEKVFADEANTSIQERIDQFGKEKNVKIKRELIAATDFVTKLNAVIEADSGVPDIISADSTRLVNYYPNIPCIDVSDIVNDIHKDRPYFEAAYEGTKLGGVHYYVPFFSSSTLMFVRKDKLAEKGISKMPETWDEVIDAAKKVSDPANDFYGLGMGCGDTDDDDENMYREWLWNEGGSLFNEDGSNNSNTEAWVKITNLYADLYQNKVIPPDALTWDSGGNNNSYLQGRTAIVFNAPTLYNALRGNEQYKELLENTAVLAPPKGSANGIYMNFNRGFGITKACRDKETAVDLLRYLLDKDWYDSYFQYTAPIFAPLFQEEKDNPLWKDDAVNAQVLKYAENASGYYGYPVQTLEGLSVAAKHMYTFPLEKVMNQAAGGTKTAEEAIAEQMKMIDDFRSQVKKAK